MRSASMRLHLILSGCLRWSPSLKRLHLTGLRWSPVLLLALFACTYQPPSKINYPEIFHPDYEFALQTIDSHKLWADLLKS
jgi:hypothetical protein